MAVNGIKYRSTEKQHVFPQSHELIFKILAYANFPSIFNGVDKNKFTNEFQIFFYDKKVFHVNSFIRYIQSEQNPSSLASTRLYEKRNNKIPFQHFILLFESEKISPPKYIIQLRSKEDFSSNNQTAV